MSKINPNSFGSPRTKVWANRIIERQNNKAGLTGLKKAGKVYGTTELQKSFKNDVRSTAPPRSDETTHKQQSNLGTGRWSAMG